MRNQIDYILINNRFRNSFISIKTFPVANISSDHTIILWISEVKFQTNGTKKTQTEEWFN